MNYSSSGQRKIFLDLQVDSNQDLEKVKQVILDEIKSFESTDHIDEAQVIILKQSFGIFYLQARFFMKSGKNIMKVKSDALLKLKGKLEEEGIELASQTQINTSIS